MTDTINGSVENGFRHEAEFPFYKGIVGTRSVSGQREIAYIAPSGPSKLPADGKVDGKPVRAISRVTQGVQLGFVVLVVVDAE